MILMIECRQLSMTLNCGCCDVNLLGKVSIIYISQPSRSKRGWVTVNWAKQGQSAVIIHAVITDSVGEWVVVWCRVRCTMVAAMVRIWCHIARQQSCVTCSSVNKFLACDTSSEICGSHSINVELNWYSAGTRWTLSQRNETTSCFLSQFPTPSSYSLSSSVSPKSTCCMVAIGWKFS